MSSPSTAVAVEEATPDISREDAADTYLDQLEAKILFGLKVYPFLSPSMLHVFLGTSTPTALWKDQVLARLIEEGKVISTTVSLTSPFERSQTYTVLHLVSNVYPLATSAATSDPQTGVQETNDQANAS
jgi:hypothetical protein